MNILLIGNSHCATSMEMGKEIDNFNGLVARFNAFQIEGYEKHVGTRTDVWITCGVFQKNMNRDYKEVLVMSILLNHQEDKNLKILQEKHPHAERVRYETVFNAKQMVGYNMPSTGAVATTHFLSKGFKVFLYGFNFMFDNMPHHYSDNVKKGDYHCPELEWIYFNKLLMNGTIEYLGWDRRKQSTPILRIPEKCGGKTISEYRESTQLGWYNWIARECVNNSVLDVGCGMGTGLKMFSQVPGCDATGVDEDPALKDIIDNYICGFENIQKTYNIVTCIDVIEHVVDDVSFFRRLLNMTSKKLFITTPNFSRSRARNTAHCREFTISQFMNIFSPHELWVASPDGWFHLQKLIGDDYNHFPLDKVWNDNSVDDLEWAHMCGVWYK